jgi:hypothetical protein
VTAARWKAPTQRLGWGAIATGPGPCGGTNVAPQSIWLLADRQRLAPGAWTLRPPIAVGAAHVHLPAQASRYAQCLDFHENKRGTFGRLRQANLAATRYAVILNDY